jgi:hypothetical protein
MENLRATTPSGLCATCTQAAFCMYLRSGGPAVRCNEFDDGGRVASPPTARGDLGTPRSSGHVTAQGLCRTCEHLSTCTMRQPAMGVWHCEEYR